VSASKTSIARGFTTESLARPVFVPRAALIVALGLMVVTVVLPNPIVPAVAAVGLAAAAAVSHRAYGRRLRDAADLLRVATSGDLRVRVGDGHNDGLGRILSGVDEVLADGHRLLELMQTSHHDMTRLYRELDDAHTRNTQAVETTFDQVSAAADRTRQMSEMIHVVAVSSTQLVESVREIATHATAAAQIADTASSQAAAAGGAVSDLSDASDHVGAIAQMIATIASQTKLLALNATIEAARAGAAGQGFAVVAAEVKELAGATAIAVKEVSETVNNIGRGSIAARTALHGITEGVLQVNASQASISSAIVEQNAAAYEISRVAADAASESTAIASNVKAMSDFVRKSAYVNTTLLLGATTLRDAQQSIDPVLQKYAATETRVDAEVATDERNALGTQSVNGTHVIQDGVVGKGLFQFDYSGYWLHAEGDIASGATDTYSISTGDRMRMRFTGSRIRFFGNCEAHHGMIWLSVDGGSPTLVDEYAVGRVEHAMLWDSGPLARGEHVLEAEVADEKNPLSRFFWVTIDRVEVDD